MREQQRRRCEVLQPVRRRAYRTATLRSDRINPDVARKVQSALDFGVTLGACGNTMAAQKITVADLVPGFVPVDEGGVTRLAKLQAEGYAYIRP